MLKHSHLVSLALSAIVIVQVCSAFVPVNHTAGLCLWYGQCDSNDRGALNCYNNTPARSVDRSSDIYSLLQDTCPWYAIGEDIKLCCDLKMLQTLNTQVQAAQKLLQKCPGCMTNFMKLFCATTCDPNAATFMNVTSGDINSKNAIKKVEVYMLTEYVETLFDSCKNVKSSQDGTRVIGSMCGTSADQCTAEGWLNFMGDPTRGSPVPFTIHYNYLNTAKQLPDGTVPYNASQVNCWESDPFYNQETCSCADCPAVCPDLPHHQPTVIPTVLGIHAGAFYTLLVVPAWIFICMVVVAAMYGYGCGVYCTKKKHNIEDEQVHSSCPCPFLWSCWFVPLDFVGYHFDRVLRIGFEKWGFIAAKFWFIVIPVAFLIVGILAAGLTQFEITTDPVELWSAPHSQAREEKNYFDEKFGPFYRTEQIIVTTNLSDYVGHTFVIDNRQVNITLGPIFNKTLLIELLELQNYLTNMSVPFKYKNGTEENITLSDICFKPVNQYCTIQSVFQYFQNSEKLLNASRSDYFFFYGNYISHIDLCTKSPSSLNMSDLDIPCMSQYGGPVDPNVILGGFNTSTNQSVGPDYGNATALILTFIVTNHLEEELNAKAEVWEKAFLNFLQNYKSEFFNFTYSAQRSIQDELSRESESDVLTVAISYCLMLLYIVLFIAGFKSFYTLVFDRLYFTGLCGVLLVVWAVLASLGFLSYMKVTASLIIIEVVPFLVLAVGVDNLFIIMHAYERQRREQPTISVNECISKAMGTVGPSITLTATTESCAFLLGAVSQMPAVRAFSLYAGCAVLFNFLLQITVFISILKLDMTLLKCCLGRFERQFYRLGRINGISLLQKIVREYSKVILHWSVRPIVIMFFGVTSILSVALVVNGIPVGLDQTVALPKDSYLLNYFNDMYKYLHTGPPVYFVVKDGYNYTVPEQWNKICMSGGCSNNSLGVQVAFAALQPNYSSIAEPASSWVDSYLAWVDPVAKCCGYYANKSGLELCEIWNTSITDCIQCLPKNTTGPSTHPNYTAFLEFLPLFKVSIPDVNCDQGGHAAFNDAIQMIPNEGSSNISEIGATYFMSYTSILKTSDDYVSSIKHIRELTRNISEELNHEVFGYSVYIVFYEQYLTIVSQTLINLGASFVAVAFMTFLFLQFSIGATCVVMVTVVMIILHMFGCMALFGVNMNAVSLVNLVMTVGISVEFCSHIVRWFYYSDKPGKVKRAQDALEHMGTSVISGITITKFLGVFILLFAKSQLFEIYYFRMYMCMVVLGAAHGLIFLPVLLSCLGPTPRWRPKPKHLIEDSLPNWNKPTLNGSGRNTPIGTPREPQSLYPTLPPDEKSPLLKAN